MRIGFIGAATDTPDDELRQALEFLLGDAGVEQAICLGTGESVMRIVTAWRHELGFAEGDDEQGFLDRAAQLVKTGTPAEIDRLLQQETEVQRLEAIRCLPAPPARAIEVLEGWILIAVHDKGQLDEEDVANAHVIVYGVADDASLHRFGPRYFFTPGSLACGKVGVLEWLESGQLQVSVYAYNGTPIWTELLQARAPQLVVTT